MLSVLQPRRATLSPMCGLRERLQRWWMVMTNDEQRDILVRGATVAVCAVAASVTLPVLGSVNSDMRAEADFREQSIRLATIEDGGATVRSADHTPALLDSPWLRTVEYTLKRDPASSMTRYAMRDRDGAALRSLVSFRPEHIERAETISAEQKCLAQAIYYESRNEAVDGQLAVAEVITNRVNDHRYPNSICDVVYQGSTRTTGCQFTFTCDGATDRAPVGKHWERAKMLASHVLMDLNEERTGGATHYHATYVDPVWNAGLIRTDKIGTHIFYRFPRGAEWAQVRQDFSRKRRAPNRQAIVASTNTNNLKTVSATISPSSTVTSTRTITNGAPRLTTIRRVTHAGSATPAPKKTGTAYTERQVQKSSGSSSAAGALR